MTHINKFRNPVDLIYALNALVDEVNVVMTTIDGLVTTTGTLVVDDGKILSNISGGPALAIGNTQTAILDYTLGNSDGDVAVRLAGTWTGTPLVQPAAGLTISGVTFALANDLAALEALGSTGIAVRSAADTWVQRSVAGTASRISVSNGSGVAGNPTVDIDAAYVGQTSITTLGTIGTGTWQGTVVGVAYGGTGANLSATGGTDQFVKQETLGGAFTVGTAASTDLSDTANIAYINAANVFSAVQTVDLNSGTLPTAVTGTAIRAGQANGTPTLIAAESFAEETRFVGRRANTTAASPSALSLNNIILRVEARGYGATAYGSVRSAALTFLAAEAWTDTAQGSYIFLGTTEAGTTGMVNRLRIYDDGGHTILGAAGAAPTGASKGVGTINVAGNYYVNGALYEDTAHTWTAAQTNMTLVTPTLGVATATTISATSTGSDLGDQIFDLVRYSTAQLDKTSNTTYESITGLGGVTLQASKAYRISGRLTVTSGAVGGIKARLSLGGATSLSITTLAYNGTLLVGNTTVTTTTDPVLCAHTAVITDIIFEGVIVVDGSNRSPSVQAAQNVSDATTTSVLINSSVSYMRMN